jgi:hypothetical protein
MGSSGCIGIVLKSEYDIAAERRGLFWSSSTAWTSIVGCAVYAAECQPLHRVSAFIAFLLEKP